MSRDKTDYTHADTGTKPSSLNFQANDRPNSEYFDWWWYTISQAVDGHADEFDRLDSDDDGRVDLADSTQLVKGNDIDSNGDGTVDEADSALTYKGNDIDSDGDGSVDNADTADYANDADASTYKGNDIDSDGDGKVDNADKVDGHNVFVQSTAPSSPALNDVWIDTS